MVVPGAVDEVALRTEMMPALVRVPALVEEPPLMWKPPPMKSKVALVGMLNVPLVRATTPAPEPEYVPLKVWVPPAKLTGRRWRR